MEVIVVHAREHLNLMNSDGYPPLSVAAMAGHSTICSLLAAEVLACSVKPYALHARMEMSMQHTCMSRDYSMMIKTVHKTSNLLCFLSTPDFSKHQHSFAALKVHSTAQCYRVFMLEYSRSPCGMGGSSESC